jgi:hypothetical protein
MQERIVHHSVLPKEDNLDLSRQGVASRGVLPLRGKYYTITREGIYNERCIGVIPEGNLKASDTIVPTLPRRLLNLVTFQKEPKPSLTL